ncbi:MAG: transglutaminase-like domain-containing protein [Dysgonamonadaceae bacterium]|jgi:transglutaminase-like putative cysteine protease|nr:transglutaminase-like domain-containing protein [Dysgonamonadaceae bacterium]
MKQLSYVSLIALFLFSACGEKETHFLKDRNYREQVHQQFEKRKMEAAKRKALFSVFEKENLSTEQREALEFLYAYMPLSDLADYDGEFFLKQVDAAFRARDFFSWGKTVPDDLFRHFVLVYRVNNEHLDTARIAFFEALKDRVKNLSMYDAALEVNHWCHEKVTYRGTDARTSAPLALVRTSWGRCGEESTFTTTALRAVGIPARQCYTPRWVHTDDNHAWVEVWVDGQWHYLGACEPEPELDAAWFTGPVKRSMMVHTNVFGPYKGPEEKNLETPLYSKINLLSNYTETRTLNVQVVDTNNRPVEGAQVQFKVYNYAEFYPIAAGVTGKDGKTSILSGKGDLLVWANKGNVYGYEKSGPQDDIVIVKLHRQPGFSYEENFVINVPSEQAVTGVSTEKMAANAIRLSHEDSIRNAYMQTFINENEARNFARQNQLDSDEVWKYLSAAQGNWPEISRLIEQTKNDSRLFRFLSGLTEKDLRDTPADYLKSYLENQTSTDLYVFSPRIEQEIIRPWRNFSLYEKDKATDEISTVNVHKIIDYVNKNIKINDEENYFNCRISPLGVYELQIADRISRDIFFVALCRNAHIPARIEPSTSHPQYLEKGQWKDVVFEEEITTQHPKTKLIVNTSNANLVKPGYYTHYTLSYFKNGDFHTLDYENNPAVKTFPYSQELEEGYYRLIVGSRANDGSVTVHTEYFELKGNTPYSLTVKLPEVERKLFVKGIVDMNGIVLMQDQSKTTLKRLSNDKGLILSFIDLGKEPSKHLLQDLEVVQKALESWDGGIVLMISDDKNAIPDTSGFKHLPRQTLVSIDREQTLLKAVTSALQITFQDNFPLTVYLSNNGGILYSSEGYKIGVGENILKIIKQEASIIE